MAVSPARPEARVSIKPAMFEQAISKTNPTAPSKTSSGVRVSPATKSVKGTTNIAQPEACA